MANSDQTDVGRGLNVPLVNSTRYDWDSVLGIGVTVGILAGMAVFVYIKHDLAPGWSEQWWALGLVVIAGGFVPLLSSDLDRGIITAIVALGIALLVHAIAWLLPLWTLSYDPVARDILIPMYLGRALLSYLLVVPLAFMAGYLAAVTLNGLILE